MYLQYKRHMPSIKLNISHDGISLNDDEVKYGNIERGNVTMDVNKYLIGLVWKKMRKHLCDVDLPKSYEDVKLITIVFGDDDDDHSDDDKSPKAVRPASPTNSIRSVRINRR